MAEPAEETLEGRHRLIIGLTSVGVLMVVMDSTIVNVALPIIREDLGFLEVSVSELQWVVNAYALSFAVLLLSAGKLADLFGRKRLFLIGLVIFTGASVACGAANEINVLIGFRAVQGVGAALIMPTTLSILQTSIPMSKLGIAIGIWSGIVGLGTAIGPLIGGLLAEEVDWRWVFYINIPLGLGVFLGTLLAIPESRSDIEDRSLDVVGALISAVALFALTYGLLKANEFGWGNPRTIGCLAVGVIGLAAFVAYERKPSSPMLDLGLFRSQTFAGANVVAVFVGFALFGLLFFGALFIQSIMGFSATEAGLSQLPMMAMIIVFGPQVGKLVGKVGPGPLLTVGMALLAVSFLLFYRLDFDSDFWTLLPAMVVGGIGFAAVLTPLTAAALSAVPFQQAGMGAAVINSTRQIGGALGLAVMGAISAELVAAGLVEGKASPDAFVDGFGVLMLTGAGVAATGSVVAWITIARPARAARAAAAAAARPRRRPSPHPLPRRRRPRRPSGRRYRSSTPKTGRWRRPPWSAPCRRPWPGAPPPPRADPRSRSSKARRPARASRSGTKGSCSEGGRRDPEPSGRTRSSRDATPACRATTSGCSSRTSARPTARSSTGRRSPSRPRSATATKSRPAPR